MLLLLWTSESSSEVCDASNGVESRLELLTVLLIVRWVGSSPDATDCLAETSSNLTELLSIEMTSTMLEVHELQSWNWQVELQVGTELATLSGG